MRCAIYSRFSTDRQNESSIADQVRVCSEYATREGMQVVALFEDQGISGAALGNRPGARTMMEAALARRFDVLLAMDLSRLSRSQADLPKMIDRLVAKGVRVIGVQDGYDSGRKGHKLQAGLSGIIGEAFREMIRDRTHAALETRARERRPTGGKCYGYGSEQEAAVVREIFERFADGASCRTIAVELNNRQVPSPGASWHRTERRCRGWVASAIRSMLRNERYTGLVTWNRSQWVKDPDSGVRQRRLRPLSEWHEYRDASVRLVSDELWQRAQRRTKATANDEARLKSGGKPRYLLSGLLRCSECGAHYIIASRHSYACSSHIGGKACPNSIRIRRDVIEAAVLDPIRRDLLSPERVERMAKEIQSAFLASLKAAEGRANAAPRELQDLDARLQRLRERASKGDPDLTSDELQTAIERVEQKRRELQEEQPAAKRSAKVLRILPRAADMYRRQIADGLDGNPREAAKARIILRELLGGRISLKPGAGGSLWAEYALQPAALLRGEGTDGSGGRI